MDASQAGRIRRTLGRSRRSSFVVALVASVACLLSLLMSGAANAASVPQLAWSAPALVEHAPFADRYPLEDVTCPTTTLCVAADNQGNILTSTNPTGGSADWTSRFLSQPGGVIGPITCGSASFCATSSGPSGSVIYVSSDPTGGSAAWRRTVDIVLQPSALSCPSTHLCVAFGENGGKIQIATSTDPTARKPSWKLTSPNKPDAAITGLTCVTTKFCVAVDSNGNVLTATDPAGGAADWHLVNINGSSPLGQITCPTTSFCAAISGGLLAYSTDPMGGAAAWKLTTSAPVASRGLDCLSASFCAAYASNGDVLTTTDPAAGAGTWQSTAAAGQGEINGLSCPSLQLCVVADNGGEVLTATNPASNPSTWTTTPVGGVTPITALDCPTASLCVGGDAQGHILTSTDPANGPAAWRLSSVDSLNSSFSVDCPDAELCVGADSAGDLLISTDPTGGSAAWSQLSLSGITIGAVACQSASFCLAIGISGQVLASTDPTGGASAWTVTGATLPANVTVLSCPSVSLCIAGGSVLDGDGDPTGNSWLATSTDPTGGTSAWTSLSPDGLTFSSISCPSTSLCVIAGFVPSRSSQAGLIYSSTDPAGGLVAWKFDEVGGVNINSVSCPETSFCVAAGVNLYSSRDPSGGPSAWQSSSHSDANVVSCPTTALCVAGNADGDILIGRPPVKTTTTLKLSRSRITYGHERSERLTVASRSSKGAPTGTVVVTERGKTICRLNLKSGKASCVLRARQLKRGDYKLRARFEGSNGFLASTSATKKLAVLR